MEGIYHIFSDGTKTPDLLTREQDFKDIANLLGILSNRYQVRVLAFGVEDTHLHSLVSGNEVVCTKFKKELQRLVRRTYSKNFDVDMEKVEDEGYLRNVGIYVISQATKDGKRIMPYDYKWSTASLYFRCQPNDLLWILDENGQYKEIRYASQIGAREQRTIFHTKSKVPDNWKVCDGVILPSSFVDVESFEQIYKTHNAFRTFCGSNKNNDNEVHDSMSFHRGVNLDETEAREICRNLCIKMHGFADIRSLSTDERIQLGRIIRKNYHIGLAQLARRIHLPEYEVRRYIK